MIAGCRFVLGVGLLLLLVVSGKGFAANSLVAVAVASNLSALVPDLGVAFEAETGHKIRFSVGSSGKLLTQILHGGPYDVFVSADHDRPARVVTAGLGVAGRTVTYARGRLVLIGIAAVQQDGLRERDGLRRVLAREVLGRGGRFAMANPRTAPYGLATRDVLQSLSLWDDISARAVIGESVGQAGQFVRSGSVPLGFVARAQVPSGVNFIDVPADLHRPLLQDAVLLSRAADHPAARKFMDFLVSPAAREIFKGAGYDLPDAVQ